jgi:peptide/nickel transport system permease protein
MSGLGRLREMLTADGRVLAGTVVLAVFALVAVAAPLVSPYDPLDVFSGLRNAPPGTPGHPLGMDQTGRDILSRVIWGGRVSLLMGTAPVAAAMAIGILLGLLAAYYGGVLEFAILRLMEVLFAFPLILLAILAAQAFGKGMVNAMIAMTLVEIPYVIRAVHAAGRAAMGLTYVEASIVRGARAGHVMFSEILPSIAPSLIIFAMSVAPIFVIFAAGLSYLGLAIDPPTPDWGIMIAEGQQVMQVAPHVATVPGLVLLIVGLAMNLIGDGLQAVLDPRARARRSRAGESGSVTSA